MGFPVLFTTKRPDGSLREAWFDTRQVSDVVIALLSTPINFPLLKPQKNPWKYEHVVVAIRDIVKATEFYRALGWKTLKPIAEKVWDGEHLKQWGIYGKTPDTSLNFKTCLLEKGSFIMELHQPSKGESLQKQFLDRQGEGICCICFSVNDLEYEKVKMAEKGFSGIQTIRRPDGVLTEALFDTHKVGNVMIELKQL
jgi:hypothetical protein